MIAVVFLSAVFVALALERQARRHRIEITVEYERLGLPLPPLRPKLNRTEAWINVGLGMLLILLGICFGRINLALVENLPEMKPELQRQIRDMLFGQWVSASVILASGLALASLGWKAVRRISYFESLAASASERTKGGEAPGMTRKEG